MSAALALLEKPTPTEPRLRRWTVAEYYRMAEVGILSPDERLELLDGEIVLRGTPGPDPRLWTYEEYERLGTEGIISPDERVELIDGEVLEMSPQNSRHAIAVTRAFKAMLRTLGDNYHVRCQLPLRITGTRAPEPDVAVVEGSDQDYSRAHPTTALLVLEVSDSSLAYDREFKSGLYAQARIPEYWLLDVLSNSLEVRREPVSMPGVGPGYGYRLTRRYLPEDAVSLLCDTKVKILVSDLLPIP